MAYTLDGVEGKIEVLKPWKNRKQVRIRQKSSRVILDSEAGEFQNSLLKKELDRGIQSLQNGNSVIATPDFFEKIRKDAEQRFLKK